MSITFISTQSLNQSCANPVSSENRAQRCLQARGEGGDTLRAGEQGGGVSHAGLLALLTLHATGSLTSTANHAPDVRHGQT